MSKNINPAFSWIKAFLSQRSLSYSDGRALYAYRCSDEEFQSLHGILKQLAPDRNRTIRFISYTPELFCLYASEWIRRNHSEGNPSWKPIFQAIKWPIITGPQLPFLTISGLNYWKREVRKKGSLQGYLHTLACEGGLPLWMIQNESGCLIRYFRDIYSAVSNQLTETSAFELAEQLSDSLPKSLQNDLVYEVAGEFCQQLVLLFKQAGVKGCGKLEKLKAENPSWYTSLPLVLPQIQAEQLVATLLHETAKQSQVRTGIKVVRRWVDADDCWYCDAQFKFPLLLKTAQLNKLFNFGSQPEGTRLTIHGQWSGGNTPLALLSAKVEDEWSVETYPVADKIISGRAALDEFSLSLHEGPMIIGHGHPYGGAALSPELPWTLETLNTSDTELKLLGVGSVSSTSDAVFVALPPGSTLALPEDGELHIPRMIDDCQRVLIKVTGTYKVELEDGANCIIRTGQEYETSTSYLVKPSEFKFVECQHPVHRGWPKLYCSNGQSYERVAAEQLVWCSAQRKSHNWKKVIDVAPLGLVKVRHVVDNEVRYNTTLAVLPEDAKVWLRPETSQLGFIELKGMEGAVITSRDPDSAIDIDAETTEQGILITCQSQDLHPESLQLKFRWPEGGQLDLVIPFPATGGRFVALDGTPTKHGFAGINQLFGVRAEHINLRSNSSLGQRVQSKRPSLELTVKASDLSLGKFLRLNIPLRPTAEVKICQLPMIEKQNQFKSMLRSSAELDACLQLRFSHAEEDTDPTLIVRRYDCRFQMGQGHLSIESNDVTTVTPELLDQLEIKAISLVYPEKGMVPLEKGETGYCFKTLQVVDGPWLAIGEMGGVVRVRPSIILGGCHAEGLSELQQALSESNNELRSEKLRHYLKGLATEPASPDWLELLNYLVAMKDVPPAALDIYRELIKLPEVLLFLLINSSLMGQSEIIWDVQNELPFSWGWMEIDEWQRGVEAYHTNLITSLPEGTPLDMPRQFLTMFIADLTKKSQQDARLLYPLAQIISWCTGLGISSDPMRTITDDMTEQAFQDLARLSEDFGWIYTLENNEWCNLFSATQHKKVSECMLVDQFSQAVNKLCNVMVIAAAMTAYGHRGLSPFSRVFEIAYQQAPEQLGIVYHYFIQTFRKP